MTRFYEPDLSENPNSPFVRDSSMPDRTAVTVMTQGVGANLTNDEKRSHHGE
jgi:hypothetical protein